MRKRKTRQADSAGGAEMGACQRRTAILTPLALPCQGRAQTCRVAPGLRAGPTAGSAGGLSGQKPNLDVVSLIAGILPPATRERNPFRLLPERFAFCLDYLISALAPPAWSRLRTDSPSPPVTRCVAGFAASSTTSLAPAGPRPVIASSTLTAPILPST